MTIVQDQISINELQDMASKMFGNLVKAVVDIKKGILIVDADLHSDQESFLLNEGSNQKDLWGINIYPDKKASERIEFDSMINLRPSFGNNSRNIEDKDIQEKISEIVNLKISE